MKITKIYDIVLNLLKADEKYRNSDNKLVVRIWYDEMYKIGKNPKSLSFTDFLTFYRDEKLTSADSITRARRKVQEEHPELRGYKYNHRQAHTEDVKAEIRQISADLFN